MGQIAPNLRKESDIAMRFLVDICHPAHFHFFRNPVNTLRSLGHDVLITSRDKEVTLRLIENEGWDHRQLCPAAKKSSGLLSELVRRDVALYKLAKEFKPHVMAAIGGIFVAHAGFASRTPSVVFYDTENARLQNFLTYPFASLVSVPSCYEGWLPRSSERYPGYHELSYLHPDYFQPDRVTAVENGLSDQRDTFLIRVVAWQANHDFGEAGWSLDLLEAVVTKLTAKGKVIISAEVDLPSRLLPYRYEGSPSELHHVLAFCRLFVGESATMASESVVLGVPAIYAAETGRGYCNQQENEYGMLENIHTLDLETVSDAIDRILKIPREEVRERWEHMLSGMIDVSNYIVNLLESMGANHLGLSRSRSK